MRSPGPVAGLVVDPINVVPCPGIGGARKRPVDQTAHTQQRQDGAEGDGEETAVFVIDVHVVTTDEVEQGADYQKSDREGEGPVTQRSLVRAVLLLSGPHRTSN